MICSFWLVSALALIGETQRANLGNFPQAFSHLALVEAGARLIVAEGLAEVASPA